MAHWHLLLPPDGGARQAATNLLHAMQTILPPEELHIFDCNTYLSAFNQLLKKPDETMAVDLMNQSLVVQCLQYETTHCIIPALCPITLFTLNLLKRIHIITIHWFIEDYRRATYWEEILPGYTWFLAVQKGPLPEQCEKRGCKFAYLPTAASDESVRWGQHEHISKKTTDLSFIGLPSTYRVRFLETLLQQGFSLAIAGEGWTSYSGPLTHSIIKGTWVDNNEALSIAATASIVLNLSFHDPAGDRTDHQLSPRVYDVLAQGACLLTEEVPLLRETLEDCFYVTFTDVNEASTKIQEILAGTRDTTIEAKLHANTHYIRTKHTWLQRAQQLIELVQ